MDSEAYKELCKERGIVPSDKLWDELENHPDPNLRLSEHQIESKAKDGGFMVRPTQFYYIRKRAAEEGMKFFRTASVVEEVLKEYGD